MGLAVQPPDVNASRYEFAVGGCSAPSATAWARCKGVGRGRGRGAHRRARGARPLSHAEDLCRRARSDAKVNRRALEALMRSRQPRCAWARTARRCMDSLRRRDAARATRTRARARGRPERHVRSGADASAARRAGDARHALPEWSEARAPGGRARDARAVSDRPSDRPLRGGPAALRLAAASAISSASGRSVPAGAGAASARGKPVTRRRADR